jgi:hypothetical protein
LGRTSTEDDPKTGRPSTSADDDHIEKVRAVICENRRLSVKFLKKQASLKVYHTILTEKLEMHRVAAKFVPRLLTDEQKANRVTVSQELFDRSNVNENFLKNVSAGDETWVYGHDIETKAQSCQSRSNVKVLLISLSLY